MTLIHSALKISLFFLLVLSSVVNAKPTVCLQTNLGELCIELFDQSAPDTVSNFLNYVNDGDYIGSIIHRSVPGFIIQGGGFIITENIELEEVPADATIANEFSIYNTRATVAMAKVGGDPDSASNQWFINLSDNAENLDAQNGGFTVFGQVSDEGMVVVDAIAALQRINFGGALGETPVIDYTGEGSVQLENFVVVTGTKVIKEEATGTGEQALTLRNHSITGNISEQTINKNIGEKIRILVRPKPGYISTIKVDGEIVKTADSSTRAIRYRLTVSADHLIETSYIINIPDIQAIID